MIQVTQEQLEKVEALRVLARQRGRTLNTRIVYELWPLLFGVRKRPNGCASCLRADMNAFFTKWDELRASNEIEVLGPIPPEDQETLTQE